MIFLWHTRSTWDIHLLKQIFAIFGQLTPLLQAARKSAGLSQTELSKRLDLSQSRLSAMELNPNSIRLDQLLVICATPPIHAPFPFEPKVNGSVFKGSSQAEKYLTTLLTAQLLFGMFAAPDGHAKNFSIKALPQGR